MTQATVYYLKEHMLYSDRNKKVLGKMKDECEGRTIKEAVAIRPNIGTQDARRARVIFL